LSSTTVITAFGAIIASVLCVVGAVVVGDKVMDTDVAVVVVVTACFAYAAVEETVVDAEISLRCPWDDNLNTHGRPNFMHLLQLD
jgi:hypothetical protein